MAEDKQPSNDPFSALLASAFQLHELYNTFVEAGFDRKQSLYLCGELLKRPTEGA